MKKFVVHFKWGRSARIMKTHPISADSETAARKIFLTNAITNRAPIVLKIDEVA